MYPKCSLTLSLLYILLAITIVYHNTILDTFTLYWRIQACKKMYWLTSVSTFAPTSFLIFRCGGRHDKAIFDVFFGIRQSLFSHHDLSVSASEAVEAEAEAVEASKKRKISSFQLKYRRRTKVSGKRGTERVWERLFRAALHFAAQCSKNRTFSPILIFAQKPEFTAQNSFWSE